jgi:hypothetical protein
LEVFVELMKGFLFAGIAVAFFVLAWMFLRLARIFSTTEQTIKDVSGEVVPLLGKTHVTVDNINSQLTQLDEAVGDVAGMTGDHARRQGWCDQGLLCDGRHHARGQHVPRRRKAS